jgi:hypothetical protein
MWVYVIVYYSTGCSIYRVAILYVQSALTISNLHFEFVCFVWFSLQKAIISLNSVNQLICVMVKCGVHFEIRAEFLNNI